MGEVCGCGETVDLGFDRVNFGDDGGYASILRESSGREDAEGEEALETHVDRYEVVRGRRLSLVRKSGIVDEARERRDPGTTW